MSWTKNSRKGVLSIISSIRHLKFDPFKNLSVLQGRSQDFFKGGITLCQNEGTFQIVMSSSLPVVGCLLKTWLTKGGGGGHGHPRTPWLRPCSVACSVPTAMHLTVSYRTGLRKQHSNGVHRGYYTVARRHEFYVRVARTISHE